MKRTALIFALVALPLSVYAQTVYKCGNAYSQQPCAPDAKQVDIRVSDGCEVEANRYRSDCYDKRSAKDRQAEETRSKEKSPVHPTLSGNTNAADAKRYGDLKESIDKQLALAKKQISEHGPITAPSKAQVRSNETACKKQIASQLKDPDSATFKDISRNPEPRVNLDIDTGRWVPGIVYSVQVNARNGFGGYVGYKEASCIFDLAEKVLVYSHVY